MKITRLNYTETLPFLSKTIKKSQYISLDLQMTGIIAHESTNPSIIDSMQIRYLKYKQKIQKYIPIQLGLTAIELQHNKVVCYPFNFYIYPLCSEEHSSQNFSFNSSSMHFLAQNNFDFNLLFYEGIPYLNKQQYEIEKQIKKQLEIRKQMIRLNSIISPNIIAFVNLNMSTIQKWINQNQFNNTLSIDIKFIKVKAYLYLLEEIQAKFKNYIIQVTYDKQEFHQRNFMYLTLLPSHQPQIQIIQTSPIELQLFNEVFNIINTVHKPLILHNGYLDLMHVYRRFYGQLPFSNKEYIKKLHKIFPQIYDTKYICNSSPILHTMLNGNTSLGNCFEILAQKQPTQNKIPIQIHQSCKEYDLNSLACHQAGFDSLMTSCVFIRALEYTGKSIQQSLSSQQDLNLIKNKIPLSSIKVPLNLQETSDVYSTDGGNQIYLKFLTKCNLSYSDIIQKIRQQIGLVSVHKGNFKNQFILFCMNQSQYNRFCQLNLDSNKIGIITIQQCKVLVYGSIQSINYI